MNKIMLGSIALIIAIGAISCKTTEKNYRQAYEKAVMKEKEGVDSTTYNKIKEEEKGAMVAINGEDVRIKSEYLQIADGEQSDMKNYGVVVGQFKQVFNARSFRDRLKSKKYPSYVVINRDGIYYVVIKGFDKNVEAAEYLKNIKKNVPFAIPLENAWIIAPVR
ncbi:MAG: SPOR domain-containing protein [Muribaculaceae bacterium]